MVASKAVSILCSLLYALWYISKRDIIIYIIDDLLRYIFFEKFTYNRKHGYFVRTEKGRGSKKDGEVYIII